MKRFEIFRADADALLADGGGLIFGLTTVCSVQQAARQSVGWMMPLA
jgi:hypothetical protein